ncbi:uncharacterized protein LOC106641642 isoform X2 [Copidosoma floridanum]|uniref:uncharacterized protein LOC106641642 isoform X2 n=1 Tax=Copidosoma floridanum TaxID=29053 RepID=UPI0006C9D423|nr:uncharacterized protein LOC106641642 isoform X2 [Copidosoma floridanum]
MDSKKKFNKNRYWKKKYQPRNGAVDVNKPSNIKVIENVSQSEELENDFTLKQPVPKDGWFPESESDESSDLEDFSSLIKTSSHKQSEKNWFDKELDNVQVASDVAVDTKNIEGNENLPKSVSNSKIVNSILKKVVKDKKLCDGADDEEKELDFLLSLREPVYTGSVFLKKETKVVATNSAERKPVKSIDLEKWLDSVLDD